MKKPTVEADCYGGDNHGDIYNIQVLNSGGQRKSKKSVTPVLSKKGSLSYLDVI